MVLENKVHVGPIVYPVRGVKAQVTDWICGSPLLCQAVADVEQQ